MSTTNKNYYKEYIDSLKTAADTNYTQAVNNAELERQRAVLEAGNQYNSSRAISGANAQALSASGLTGSGYSRYLDSQAYAQKQGSINSAFQNKQSAINAAESIKNDAYMTAEGLYADYLRQKDAERQTGYNNIYENLSAYSLSDIDRLGTEFGLDTTQIDALKAAKNELTYSSLLGSNYGLTYLDNLVKTGHLDNNSTAYTNLVNDATNVTADEITFTKTDGSEMTYSEAKALIDDIKADGTADETVMSEIEKKLEDRYTAKTTNSKGEEVGATFFKDSGIRGMFKDKTGTEGNNIKVKIGDDVYKVEYNGNKIKKSDIPNAPTEGTVFMYNGTLYLMGNDGNAYGLRSRATKQKGDKSYKELLSKFG